MGKKEIKEFGAGAVLITAFVLWTVLIQCVDVQPAGESGTNTGLASINTWFHRFTGVHMGIYTITDWLGMVPILICAGFGILGLFQMIRRRSLLKVDPDIILLGIYYLLVILCYLFFEAFPVNYRPILIEGATEASYPSSTTLLVLSVMPTLVFQVNRRTDNRITVRSVLILSVLFSLFMVTGRLVAGVHWLTDIIGGALLSTGLFMLYRAAVTLADQKKQPEERNNE